ncbi:MAG TPA: PAN domain-containing protein [Xanthobacteraceae bacterium]|nr:PAN domain-containing protein [Xanthobacteraceae bacterium]
MARVFLAYKRLDAARAQQVRTNLEALGVSLFVDVKMDGSQNFITVINQQLSEASAVLVLWTEASTALPGPDETNFVLSEAERGYSRGVLVQSAFDHIAQKALPVPFNTLHAPDLSDWIESGGSQSHPHWQKVLEALGRRLNRPGLVPLAAALDAGSCEAKHAFLRRFPEDPAAGRVGDELEAVERDLFEQQMAAAQQRLSRRVSDGRRKLNECRNSFEIQIAHMRQGKDFTRPDPMKAFDAKAEALRDELDKHVEARRALEQRIEDASRASATAIAQAAAIDAKMREMDASLQAVQSENEALSRKYQAAARETEGRNAEFEQLQATCNQIQSEAEALSHRYQSAVRERDAKGRELGDLRAKYHELQNEASVVPELRAKVATLAEETTTKQSEIDALNAHCVSLSKRAAISKGYLGAGLGVAAVIGLAIGWAAVLATAPIKADSTQETIQAKDDEIQALQKQLIAAQGASEANQKALQRKTDEIVGLTKRMDAAQEQAKSLQAQNDKKDSSISSTTQLLEQQRKEAARLQGLYDQARTQLNQGQAETARWKSQFDSAQSQLGAQQKDLNEAKTSVASLQGQLKKLQDDTVRTGSIAASAASPFRFYQNTDMEGSAYLTKGEVTRNWCVSACLQDEKCVAYTFDKWHGHCSLKDKIGELRIEASGDTGVRGRAQEAYSKLEPQFCAYDKRAFQSETLETRGDSSTEECRELCRTNKSCIAFTYLGATKTCRLFATTTRSVTDPKSTSGVKAQKPEGQWCPA